MPKLVARNADVTYVGNISTEHLKAFMISHAHTHTDELNDSTRVYQPHVTWWEDNAFWSKQKDVEDGLLFSFLSIQTNFS